MSLYLEPPGPAVYIASALMRMYIGEKLYTSSDLLYDDVDLQLAIIYSVTMLLTCF